MATAGSDAVPDLMNHLLAHSFFFEEADIFHPGDNDDDSQAEFLGLIQQSDRGDGICQDRVDAGLPH